MRIGSVIGLLAVCLLGSACALFAPQQAAWRMQTGHAGDTLRPGSDNAGMLIDLQSERGIGSASIELLSGSLPNPLRLRLHLNGLEQFRLSYGQTELRLAVASQPGHAVSQLHLLPNGDEQPVLPGSPFWQEVQTNLPDPPFGPGTTGEILISLPQDLLQSSHTTFHIEWVDFFR